MCREGRKYVFDCFSECDRSSLHFRRKIKIIDTEDVKSNIRRKNYMNLSAFERHLWPQMGSPFWAAHSEDGAEEGDRRQPAAAGR